MKKKTENGQILLIVLLILAVLVTIALSLIGRSTTNTNISTQIEESSKAFSAAEAGIEQALNTHTSVPQSTIDGVKYSVLQESIGGGGASLNAFPFPTKTNRGMSETLWLCPHDDVTGAIKEGDPACYTTPQIDLCWTSGTPAPAIVLAVFYKDISNGQYKVARAAYDPDLTRRSSNYFLAPDDSTPTDGQCAKGSYAGLTQAYHHNVKLNNDPFKLNNPNFIILAIRIRPLYNDTNLALSVPGGGTQSFPKQGDIFTGTGTTSTNIQRTIRVEKYYQSPSSIFDYVIYSQQGPFRN